VPAVRLICMRVQAGRAETDAVYGLVFNLGWATGWGARWTRRLLGQSSRH
jgi:hypothetical protein